MTARDKLNPYASPVAGSEPGAVGSGFGSTLLRRWTRALALGASGVATYWAAFAWHYRSMDYPQGIGHDIWWIGSTIFALALGSSEWLNVGRGSDGGLVRRVLISTGLMLLSIVLTAVICGALEWPSRATRQDSPKYFQIGPVLGGIFIAALFAVRYAWIGTVRGAAMPAERRGAGS